MRGTGDPADDSKSARFFFGFVMMLSGLILLSLGFALHGFSLRMVGLICLALGGCLSGYVYLMDRREHKKHRQR